MTDRRQRVRPSRLSTNAELLAATGGDAFVRYDLPDPLEGPGWSLGTAVMVPRRTVTRRILTGLNDLSWIRMSAPSPAPVNRAPGRASFMTRKPDAPAKVTPPA